MNCACRCRCKSLSGIILFGFSMGKFIVKMPIFQFIFGLLCYLFTTGSLTVFSRRRVLRKDRNELNYYCVYVTKPTNDGADCSS